MPQGGTGEEEEEEGPGFPVLALSPGHTVGATFRRAGQKELTLGGSDKAGVLFLFTL